MNTRPGRSALTVCLAAVLVAVGCGGGGSTSTTALTKEQFVSRANTICAQTQKKAAAFQTNYPGPHSTPAQEQAFLRELAPVTRETATRIAALPAPAGDEAKVAAIKNAISAEAAAFAKGAESPPSADAVIKDSALYSRTDKATKAYGLTMC